MIAGDEEDDWKPGNSDVGEDDDESESIDSDASAEAEEDEDADDADDDDDDTGSARRQKATSSTKKAPIRRKRRAAGSPNHIRKLISVLLHLHFFSYI
ncbi:unnamed protein product [Dibothriocephalus latus]|uniref:Uncharacterized protein n=1 Tax=Dibothriocephalus latus TaxID=60516 RepID=A0A3P7PWZ6_DIBLA|nr:unnamed protein product [Dibothriocephalus latus]